MCKGILLCLFFLNYAPTIFSLPHHVAAAAPEARMFYDEEMVLVEELVRRSLARTINDTEPALLTLSESTEDSDEMKSEEQAESEVGKKLSKASNDGGQKPNNKSTSSSNSNSSSEHQNDEANDEFVPDTTDDLIFPVKKHLQKQQQQQQQQQDASSQKRTDEAYHQIDLLTSVEEDSLTSSSASGEHAGDVVQQHEIELRTANAAGKQDRSTASIKPIDMSDFLTLIPTAQVKAIAANYYRNDPEVQRAYAFLSGHNFSLLKQHIIQVPEMASFLRYLNNSGLNVLEFVHAITNLTSNPIVMQTHTVEAASGNEIEKELSTLPATTIAIPTIKDTTTKEQLNGLHGLVDSILDVLPQDQILAAFFDKLESNEQFSKLVNSIGTPAFAQIISNMQNSIPLKNLIFTLHNNGIYITRIVDSLKSYFFLGTF